jgi:hypothetical protein
LVHCLFSYKAFYHEGIFQKKCATDLYSSDVVNVKPRFKSAPSDETLDVIAKARTEVTTNRQTNWGVKL